MADLRGVAYAVVLFVVLVALSMPGEAPWLLFAGVPSGLLVGYRAGGVLRGLAYGAAAGACLLALLVGTFWYVAVSTGGPTYPGVGLNVAAAFAIGVVVAAESALGGAAGGFLG